MLFLNRFITLQTSTCVKVCFVWFLSNFQSNDGSALFDLVAVKTRRGEPVISGDYIIDTEKKINTGGLPEVTMVMNPEGTRLWKRLTAENISRAIAIMIDGKLFSFPTVMDEIPNGKSTISGHFTEEEAFIFNKLLDGLDDTNVLKQNLRRKLLLP